MSVHEPAAADRGASPEPVMTPSPSAPSTAQATAGTPSAGHVKYEMAHDVLARQVFRTASSDAQARRKVEKFIREERSRWEERHGPRADERSRRERRGPRLTQEDFDYIKPHLDAVNLEEADRQFVRDAERSLDDEREGARQKARKWNFIRIGLSLVFAAAAVVMFALWQQGKNRLDDLQVSYERLDEREGLLYKLLVNMEMREAKCAEFTTDVCNSIKDLLRVTGDPLPSQRESAYKAVNEARAFGLLTDRFDFEVLFRYQAVQFVHGDVLNFIGAQLAKDPDYLGQDLARLGQGAAELDEDRSLADAITSLPATIERLDQLVKTLERARGLSTPQSAATLKEQRDAYVDYLDQVKALRGSRGKDADAIQDLNRGIDLQFASLGNVVQVALCNDRVDNFCPPSPPGPSTLRAGRTAYATVWYAATRPRQRVEFRWAQDGVPRGREPYVVESVNPAGYRVFAQVTNPQPGNWEFQVYNEQKRLVDKSVFTVK